MTRRLLPGSPDDLRGLRARRYVRVSSDEQGTKYGPDFQHDEIDRLVARLGLVETGPAFVDEASAWSRSAERPALRELVAAATAGTFDVLAVAYFSRWSRDTEVALRIRRELHAAGVVLFFGDEWFLSSDENSHERFLQEATAAEIYSVRLSRTIRKTFGTKFERYGDQAGTRGPGSSARTSRRRASPSTLWPCRRSSRCSSDTRSATSATGNSPRFRASPRARSARS